MVDNAPEKNDQMFPSVKTLDEPALRTTSTKISIAVALWVREGKNHHTLGHPLQNILRSALLICEDGFSMSLMIESCKTVPKSSLSNITINSRQMQWETFPVLTNKSFKCILSSVFFCFVLLLPFLLSSSWKHMTSRTPLKHHYSISQPYLAGAQVLWVMNEPQSGASP